VGKHQPIVLPPDAEPFQHLVGPMVELGFVDATTVSVSVVVYRASQYTGSGTMPVGHI
jgi:hypothetical protein